MDEKRYKGICPVCGKELWICKSVAMQNRLECRYRDLYRL